jgi:hypothetical protein
MQEPMTQIGTISFYEQIQNALDNCERPELIAHYQHVLLGLRKIIESFGPTPQYYEWLGQFSPRNTSNQCTFKVDL